MRDPLLFVVELAVAHADAGAHALHVAGNDGGAVSHAVLVAQGAFQHVADDLHVAVAVGAEALARLHAVLVDHPQRAEAHVLRVVVVGEGKAVVRVEPAVVGVAPLGAAAQFRGHRKVLTQSRPSAVFESVMRPSRIMATASSKGAWKTSRNSPASSL